MPYEMWPDGEEALAPFRFVVLSCATCGGVNLVGGFIPDLPFVSGRPDDQIPIMELPRLYPTGPDIVPPPHTVDVPNPVPKTVLDAYTKAWPLRHLAPGAFANQIRRALEFLCADQEAAGGNLHDQLKSLADRHIFPPEIVEVASLIRVLGNRGSHADSQEVDRYDAELVDELFRSILRYVYVGPAHARRLRVRLSV